MDRNLTKGKYLPDFELEKNTYIEVKVFCDTVSLERVYLFKTQYKENKLIIIDTDL